MALRVDIDWRTDLPELRGPLAVLREPELSDVPALAAVFVLPDAVLFGAEPSLHAGAVAAFVERARQQRQAGLSFTYAVTLTATGEAVGLFQVRRLDPVFEGGECACTLVPQARGTGVFRDAAALVEGFAFGTVGLHRLEARVLVQNGRANGALRKIGAVQEGVLRRAVRQGAAYADQVLWSRIRDDWALRRPFEAPRVH